MRIALVVNSFPTLSETFIYNHAAGLQAAGMDVTVIAARPSPDVELFADHDGTRYSGPIKYTALQRSRIGTVRRAAELLAHSTARGRDLLRQALALYTDRRRALRAWLLALPFDGFDIVHLEYSALAVSWLDALPLLAPARVVVSCRGAAEQITPLVRPERAMLLRSVFERCDSVHCVSLDMRATCEKYGLDSSKAFINRPAIDARRFTRSRPYNARGHGPYHLLSTGRLHWKKGIEFALMAVRRLLDMGHDVRYEIIGGGSDEERLRFAVEDLGLSKHVSFLGKRSSTEVRQALERADIYLLPSVSEGLSNAALEAMAMEVPIVSTTAGGMAEAITDGVEGLLVPPRDPVALAERVATLLRDSELRLAVGHAARLRVEREFTIARQIAVFIAEYERLMKRTGVS